jgi:hypothetical protein
MRHRVLTGTIAALALAGPIAAQAQDLYVVAPYAAGPAPVYVSPPPYAAAPVVVAPAPGYVTVAPPVTYVVPRDEYTYVPPSYTYAAPESGYTVVNSVTGRRCTVKPDGYRWCWTP